jgi:hypothetical protein
MYPNVFYKFYFFHDSTGNCSYKSCVNVNFLYWELSVTADSLIEPFLNNDFGWGNSVDGESLGKFGVEDISFIFSCTMDIWDIF